MLSSDKKVESIGQLVEVLKHYIGLQSEYMKLDVVDKVVRLFTVITMTVVLLVLLAVSLIYLSFAAAFALAPLLGIVWAFIVVAVVYLVILAACFVFRHQWIEKPLVKFLTSLLMQ